MNTTQFLVSIASFLASSICTLANDQTGPQQIIRYPVSSVGYETSPGGRLTIIFDPPLYRDAIFSSLPHNQIKVKFHVKDKMPDGHLEAGPVGWIDLDIADGHNRHLRRVRIPLSKSAPTGPDDWLPPNIRQTSVPFSNPEFVWDVGELPYGQYLLRAILRPPHFGHRAIAHRALTKYPPARQEIIFDEYGMCHINGKPFFPIGIYQVGPLALDSVNEIREEVMNQESLSWEQCVQD